MSCELVDQLHCSCSVFLMAAKWQVFLPEDSSHCLSPNGQDVSVSSCGHNDSNTDNSYSPYSGTNWWFLQQVENLFTCCNRLTDWGCRRQKGLPSLATVHESGVGLATNLLFICQKRRRSKLMGNTSALILILCQQYVRNVLCEYPSWLMTSHILSPLLADWYSFFLMVCVF